MPEKKLKIAYYCSNRTVFPPPKNIVAANATVMLDIINGMMRRGHDVTIFASKGSRVKGAKIVDLGLPPHNLDGAYKNEDWIPDLHAAYRMTYIGELIKESHKFDLIHLHVGRVIFGLPFLKFSKCPVVFTIHENLIKEMEPIMSFYKNAHPVSISRAQRKTMPSLNYEATVYNGVDVEKFPFDENGGNNCVFLSRVSKEKGVEFAIAAGKIAGVGLNIIGPGENNYLKKSVFPFLNDKIKYKGMIGRLSPQWFRAYSKAKVLLFPIQWEEPFGLAMIEAMACGTPVVAFNRGSVSEIVKDKKTGFIIKPDDMKGMADAIKKIYSMPNSEYQKMRRDCRKHVKENFSVEKMVGSYLDVYKKILGKN